MITSTKTLTFKFGEKHLNYMRRCRDCQINVAEGAVRAGKTVDNVFAFAYELEWTPDKLHIASGSTMGNAKLNIGDCNGYGLEGLFRGRCRWGKYKGNEALIVRTATGEKVVLFAGAELANSYMKIRGNSYGMWIATEINLHHNTFIEEAFNRQLAAKHIKVFWDLNPSNPRHEIYTKFIDNYDKKQKAGEFPAGYNYEHFTIFDNATLPPGRIEEIISRYDQNSVWYIRDILGKRTVAEGRIYDCFDTALNTTDELPETSGSYYVSCDYGTQNPTVFLLWRRENNTKRWVCLREYYYSGRDSKRQKTDKEFSMDLTAWLDGIIPRAVVVDPSAASFIVELRQAGFAVQAADNDVLDGIRQTAKQLQTGGLIFSSSCLHTLDEFQAYIWDEKAALHGEDKPVKENDHCMDAVRYFVRTIIGRGLVRVRPRPKRM